MAYQVSLSPDAVADIDKAVDYYNRISAGLGFEFTDTLDRYLKNIANLPTATSIRYDNVRVKPIDTFPFTIHYTISDSNLIIILRILTHANNPPGNTKAVGFYKPTALRYYLLSQIQQADS